MPSLVAEQVLQSELAWRIIDFLAGREATETEISEKLGVPRRTLRQCLTRLQAAKLVIVRSSPSGDPSD